MNPFEAHINSDKSPMGELIEVDGIVAEVIPMTDENRELLAVMVLDNLVQRQIGKRCRQCGKLYETAQDVLDAPIWDGQGPMHQDCFEIFKQTMEDENGNTV